MRFTFRTLSLLGFVSCVALSQAGAEPIVSANFGSYNAGDLVGQNGWVQYQTQTTLPIQVVGGRVTWAGAVTSNDQDAILPFASQVVQPTEGTTELFFGLRLRVGSAGATPSYFAALNTLNTTSTTSNFQNARLVARAEGSGFVFGARVNGQTGYPFVYGTDVLAFNTDYQILARVNLVAGNANDSINLFVAPAASTLNLSTVYATATYSSGTVTDPLYGALILSQFGSASVFQSAVEIASAVVTHSSSEAVSFLSVPEPASFATLAGLAALGGVALRRRRRAA